MAWCGCRAANLFNPKRQTMTDKLVWVFFAAVLLSTGAQADNATAKQTAWRWLDNNSAAMAEANHKIWSYAETSLNESRSAAELQRLLGEAGFQVEAGVAGMPTAFVASYGSGSPSIGILAEFDALPGVSQAVSPNPEPGPNPDAGHACGHSAYGVGSTAAALAIKELMDAGEIKGTVKLYGTPAEETGIGKVYMLRAGFFRDDDVILSWHPSRATLAPYSATKALVNVKFRFRGSASHAAAQPYAGRSALDAVELMNMGVNMMREHVREDARIHYVITGGGGQPNVVPPEAEVWYYIRANTFTDVIDYFERVKQVAAGAATMTGTELEAIEIQSEIHEMLPSASLSALVHDNLTAVGPPVWTEEELAFTRKIQANFQSPNGKPYGQGIALSDRIEPLANKPRQGNSSTDVGDISWFVPVASLMVAAYGADLPTHSWPVVASTGSSIGDKALIVAAKALAATAVDLYTDPTLLAKAKQEFLKTRGDKPFETLIPADQAAPTSVR
jgi:aminobenzoyl-glutamate utilization protein B